MSEQDAQESLSTITNALKYLREHPGSLMIPGIATDLALISDRLARIVTAEKERNTDVAHDLMVNSRRIKSDYSTTSIPCLRSAYHYFRTRNRALPQALHQKLIETFPGYDPETQTFTGNRNHKPAKQPVRTKTTPDFSQSSQTALRKNYAYYKQRGKELPPELHAALIEKFPGYDPETQTFTNLRPEYDYSTASKRILRQSHGYYTSRGKELPPELHAALIAAFPTYDPEKRCFTNKGKPHDFSNTQPQTLRRMHGYYASRGRDVPTELRQALIANFPTYDPVTNRFINNRPQKTEKHTPADTAAPAILTPTAPAQPAPDTTTVATPAPMPTALTHLPLKSVQTGYGKYSLYYGKNKLLQAADKPFELVLFDKKIQMAIVRKVMDDTHHKLFVVNCKQGTVFYELRMGASDIKYIPTQHQLWAHTEYQNTVQYKVFTPNKPMEIGQIAPQDALSVRARQFITETIVIDNDKNIARHPLVQIPTTIKTTEKTKQKRATAGRKKLKAQAAAQKQAQKQVTQTPVTPIVQKPITPADPTVPQTLTVILKPIKMTLEGTYSDVYVNGTRILKKHFGTRIETFLDGTVLAIHGIDTQDPTLPRSPIWQVFNTDLKSRTFDQKNMFTNTSVYIKNITQSANQVNLHLSNRIVLMLELERELKRAKNKHFEIMTETQAQK